MTDTIRPSPEVFKQNVVLQEHAAATPKASPAQIASAWVDQMGPAIAEKNIQKIVSLFRPDGWWRDMLNIDFDFNTLPTDNIAESLMKFGVPGLTSLKVIRPNDATLVPVSDEVVWVQAFLTYETAEGRGKGFLRLRESSPGKNDWKAYTFFTALWEIKGHEENGGERRPLGAEHGVHSDDKNWLDRRNEKVSFEKEDPVVLIVGGGQNGLMLAARLAVLGIDTLIVEKNPRVGDSWRNRYKTLCLHDPVWADHFPYVSFPPSVSSHVGKSVEAALTRRWILRFSFSVYQPKDKIANWMEHYAEIMELNVWLNSTIEANPTFDEKTQKWSVTVTRDGKAPRKMQVGHLVLASGFSGEARFPTFPRDEFKGTAVHSSQWKGAAGLPKGLKAVVIGACNSGHDIAADFYEQGVDVTMVQRSHTYVMSSKHGIPGLLAGYYEENGPPLEDADLMLTSLPVNLLNEYHIQATKVIAEKDKDILDGLTKAGFKLNPYPGGLFIKYFRDGGGYYIDVGASSMIAEGKIKLKQGVEIQKLTKDGVLFADGTELKADIVVMATGYSSQRDTIKRVISADVASKMGPCWGQDAQGEIPSVWRQTGVPNFYLQVGNMFQARCYSKYTALQIQMVELGVAQAKKRQYPAYKELKDPRF